MYWMLRDSILGPGLEKSRLSAVMREGKLVGRCWDVISCIFSFLFRVMGMIGEDSFVTKVY